MESSVLGFIRNDKKEIKCSWVLKIVCLIFDAFRKLKEILFPTVSGTYWKCLLLFIQLESKIPLVAALLLFYLPKLERFLSVIKRLFLKYFLTVTFV